MHTDFFDKHWLDRSNKPAGGTSWGPGFCISWQNGPLGKEGTPERRDPNGAFIETIIESAIKRIGFYEGSGFGCDENRKALDHLKQANKWLDRRTKSRKAQGIEGTHKKRFEEDT